MANHARKPAWKRLIGLAQTPKPPGLPSMGGGGPAQLEPGMPDHVISYDNASPEDHIKAAENMMWAREVLTIMFAMISVHQSNNHECDAYCIPVELGELFQNLSRAEALTLLLTLLKSMRQVETDAD